MTNHEHPVSELSRELNLFHITMMGLGMMIGAGVFLGIGNAIFISGPGGVILTFVLNGLLAVMTACSYAELSSAIPQTGGAYNYTRIAFGRGPSFLSGWMEWFASSVAGSLYSVTFAIYVVRYLNVLGVIGWVPVPLPVFEKIVAMMIAAVFLLINFRGASETGKVGAFFTLGQTLFLIFIGILGIVVVIKDPSRLRNFDPFLPHGWSRLLVTMGFTYVAFEGFEVIAQTGDEVIDPRRNLPKAMLYSVLIVTFTYAAVAFAAVVAVKAGSPGIQGAPWEWIGQFRERGFGEAVSRLIPAGNFLLTLAIIFASTSALNATIYSATRALYALGRDKMVSPFFAKISKRNKTPWAAMLFTGVLVIVTATLLPTMDVASSASMMFILLFFLVNLSVIKVRQNMVDELTYGFLMPFFPYLPIIAIICQGILAVFLVHMSLIAWIIAPLWVLAGILIYQFYSKTRTISTKDEIFTIEEEPVDILSAYKVMVAVANPENAIGMVNTTRALSQAKSAQIELLHMVPVPDQIPLSDAHRYIWAGKEAFVEAMLYLKPRFSLSTTISYCRNIARGIISSVRRKGVNLLIIGWRGRSRSGGFLFGSTIDPIIERIPSDVVILKGASRNSYKRILVPISGGPNAAFALEVGSILLNQKEGVLTAFNIINKGKGFDLSAFINEHQGRLKTELDRVELKEVFAESVTMAILNESEQHDLVILGSTRRSLVYQATHTSIPEQVALNCRKPFIMVKEAARLESWIKRFI